MNRSEAIKLILKHEGGYVNDPKDSGGETNFGIAKKFYPNIDIKNLTVDKAVEIYAKDYWQKCKCDELNIGVALFVFDTAVNQGCGYAIKMLQEACGASIDGKIGTGTINKANSMSASTLLKMMYELRVKRYEGTKGFDRFGKGWLNRAKETLKESLKVV